MLGLIVAAMVLLPGAVMIRRREWKRADPIELSALAVIGSAAYWAITIWLVPWLGISLTRFALLSLLTAAIALVTVRRRAVSAAFDLARSHRAAVAWGLACVRRRRRHQ
jgi:hypothetical protein